MAAQEYLHDRSVHILGVCRNGSALAGRQSAALRDRNRQKGVRSCALRLSAVEPNAAPRPPVQRRRGRALRKLACAAVSYFPALHWRFAAFAAAAPAQLDQRIAPRPLVRVCVEREGMKIGSSSAAPPKQSRPFRSASNISPLVATAAFCPPLSLPTRVDWQSHVAAAPNL